MVVVVHEYIWMELLVGQLAVAGAFDLVSGEGNMIVTVIAREPGEENIQVAEEAELLEEEEANSLDESTKTMVKQLSATKSKKTNNHKMEEEPIVLNHDLD